MEKRRSGSGKIEQRVEGWIGDELRGCRFRDARHGKRLRTLLEQFSDRVGASIPFACQDWANTKAAYRLLSSDRVTEHAILAGHLAATRSRSRTGDAPLLILHDTTTFTYNRGDVAAVGITHRAFTRKDRDGLPQHYVVCGLQMHSSMVVTPEGLPLGLASVHFWTRDRFKGCTAMKRKINPTRVPIEEKESRRWLDGLRRSSALVGRPENCVHIGDRESDIYELFCLAEEVGTHFLVRTCVDRLAGNGRHTIADEMTETRVRGLHRIEVRDRKGNISEAVLEIRYRRILVLPPIGKQKQYPHLTLTVLHVLERGTPDGRDRIDWKLMTDLPVVSRKDAVEKLRWYAMRWKIETFHKILKSGCKAEESKLRTAERIINLIAVLCILSWRIFWMTMMNRVAPGATPDPAFTPLELQLLDRLHKDGADPPAKSLSTYILKLARLGGYLARGHDGPPGNTVLWRGISRLTDIQLGFLLGAQLVGN
jgi:Transposase DNA-binding